MISKLHFKFTSDSNDAYHNTGKIDFVSPHDKNAAPDTNCKGHTENIHM